MREPGASAAVSRRSRSRHASAMRIQAYPPEGVDRYAGYQETIEGLRPGVAAARQEFARAH